MELNYEQAVIHFSKLIDVDPKNPRAYTGFAEAYIAQNKLEEAKNTLNRGLSVLINNEDNYR